MFFFFKKSAQMLKKNPVIIIISLTIKLVVHFCLVLHPWAGGWGAGNMFDGQTKCPSRLFQNVFDHIARPI